ncbi:trimeric intracellular cation channel family protein [Neolewinella aurantiaca]|uniref:Trimeric intracellular cation channel family protein n=1 Tax=Neolewinella aurantiaca TaxID=2602767 RepID=A0A5C7FPS0_9BACT|nr:trimeric intracellular cation channel family protein [Neolewinella aurantiaca]TXF89718.1 trimeric intracellular cation channel family protein [Neolewinella aurantiaca]
MELFILTIDYAGTFVFAISGALAGMKQKFDVFGVFILGLTTAIGGGTLRDLLIGSTPVGWMQNTIYVYIVLGAVVFTYLFRNHFRKLRRSMFLFDTIGIALYTILGLKKALSFGLSPEICVMLGVVSATFGGVIRDVLSGTAPLIFRKEIYASACLAGGVLFLLTDQWLGEVAGMTVAIIAVFLIRFFAVRNQWSLSFQQGD